MIKYETVKADIINMERMFYTYGSDTIFYQAREVLLAQQQGILTQIQALEQQVLTVKYSL